MLVHSCLFVPLSLLPLIVYICTVLFEQINDDDDDDDDYHDCSVLYCVRRWCTMICALL